MAPKLMLEGIKVLDFTHVLAGPTSTRLMAELGAEVIKVEPLAGDMVRGMVAIKNGRSGYYIQQNRGKKSISLDLRSPKAKKIIHGLIPKMDVVVENFTPGVMKRLGLDWPVLSKINPNLIMCSISAFGQTGPLSPLPGFDYIAQAYAGVIDMIGEPDGPPYFAGLGIGDVATGAHAFGAISAALFHRLRGGRGQYLDITLLDSLFHCHEINVQGYDGTDGAFVPKRAGQHHGAVAPLGLFKGKTHWIVIIALTPPQWEGLCKAMSREDLVRDPRFSNPAKRLQNKQELIDIIEGWLASTESDDVALRLIEKHHVPVAPILSVPEAMSHPHLIERKTVRTVTDRVFGPVKVPGMPLRFSDFPETLDLQAEAIGESNVRVLREYLDMPDDEIAALQKEGVLSSELKG
ncbi:MAG: CoA transferase [Alphaproteobacteria bacterium]|nr:CoA transferase [Alphaproteobacteria bacterium]